MRALLRPLAAQAAHNPIETIVAGFILATLAYFHVLGAIKASTFLSPSSLAIPNLRPAHALLRDSQWIAVDEEIWHTSTSDRLELQQVVFDLADSALSSALANASTGASHSRVSAASSSTILTLASLPSQRRSSAVPNVPEYKFVLEQPTQHLAHGRWVTYAFRSLMTRFITLASQAHSLDILLVMAGYLLMHTTFFRLLISARALGSNFWLTAGILTSSTLAFVLSLPLALHLGIPVDPVLLTEALPFLVCTVGFDKPLRLGRAVFTHEHLYTPVSTTSDSHIHPGSRGRSSHTNQQMKPAPILLLEALDRAGNAVLRDYALEIFVLLVGASSKVGGLREMCALAALILGMDCLMSVTFYIAVMGVMVEVKRIKYMRTASSRPGSRIGSPTSRTRSLPGVTDSSARVADKPGGLRRRPSGLKDSSEANKVGKSIKGNQMQQQDPVARLKLLVLVSFVTLHVLNLCTTLTPATAIARIQSARAPSTYDADHPTARKVDIGTPAVAQALEWLADVTGRNGNETRTELIVKVLPPSRVHVVPSPSASSSKSTGVGAWENFLSGWTSLVGDPVLSKWIVVALTCSVALNAFLVKGIASGAGLGMGLSGLSSGVGVRFSAKNLGVVKEAESGGEEEDVKAKTASTIVQGAEIEPKVEKFEVTPVPGKEERRARSGTVVATDRKEKPVFDIGRISTSLNEKLPKEYCAPRLVRPAPIRVAHASVDTSTANTLALDLVDKKLELAQAHAHANAHINSGLSSSSTSNVTSEGPSSPGSPKDMQREPTRSLEECIDIFENGPRPVSVSLSLLNDEEVIMLSQDGKIQAYALEKMLGDFERAVRIRRALISRASRTGTLENSDIPTKDYAYERVFGACCENVVGYIPIPLGIAGPLKVDGELYPIPMATAEGTLVASTSRGCKALNAGGGVTTVLTQDAMTRGPAIDFPSVKMAAEAKAWIESEEGSEIIREAFESTSRFARLRKLKCAMAGRTLFVRFATSTGDAMGMNMISKGTEAALEALRQYFPDMLVLALSGNYCTDKKPAAINWIEGRGKSIVAEAIIPGKVVTSVLKTTVKDLCNLNIKKNLIGSAMAGSVGGFNAHAANILTAIFLATGQDPAQNVESSNCMTLLEPCHGGEDLRMSVTMPSIEVGTVGGGTILAPQGAVLEMLGLRGAHPSTPGANAQRLARVIAAGVMAGELSLLSALAAGHLIRAHMQHNRSQANTPTTSRPVTPGLGTPGGYIPASYSGVHTPVTPGGLLRSSSRAGSIGSFSSPLSRSESDASLPAYSTIARETEGERNTN